MMYKNLIALFVRFSMVSILYACLYGGSCKNKMAANHTDFIVDKHEQKTQKTTHELKTDPKEDGGDLYSKVDTPPTFTLQDLTIKAGREQPILLGVTGQTEGYSIKSVSVERNGCYYTEKFGVKSLNKKPIPSTGLPIILAANTKLKTGSYVFRIKIGKIGKGSKTTEQSVECMIHVIEDKVKNEPQNGSCNGAPAVQVSNHEILQENSSKNKEKQSPKKHTPQLNFTPENIVTQTGSKAPIRLQVNGKTEGYIIDSIAIRKNIDKKRQYINQPIPSSGLMTLEDLSYLTPDKYGLEIKVSKRGKNSLPQFLECTIEVTN